MYVLGILIALIVAALAVVGFFMMQKKEQGSGFVDPFTADRNGALSNPLHKDGATSGNNPFFDAK